MSNHSVLSDQVSLDLLRRFTFTELLNEDTQTRTVILLGTFTSSDTEKDKGEDVPALLTLERQNFSHDALPAFVHTLSRARNLLVNDIYHLFVAWSGSGDLKITLTQPATETHIRKASKQMYKMAKETPELYDRVVRPFINSQSQQRLQWVYNILSHKTESENIIYEDGDPETGFLILPDLKWDQSNISMLYLQCIVHTRSLASLRDLTPNHLPMLKKIRAHAAQAVETKYGVQKGDLRMFVHYQPSFYHFHVHIVHVSCHGYAGSTIGQAHLLDSIIDNLELDAETQSAPHPSGKSYYARRTLTYGLGEQHGLFPDLWKAVNDT
ncbi:MAG: hypothetical protein CYPHOPRED_002668 [Cyphobasidiales sp. Tagirdzhanova-0007]|nr:MAG: hypothetical protein CYPHOPRED_002668 [Cyphobasidiales sp. Tagirdzhanova-0007]